MSLWGVIGLGHNNGGLFLFDLLGSSEQAVNICYHRLTPVVVLFPEHRLLQKELHLGAEVGPPLQEETVIIRFCFVPAMAEVPEGSS